MQSIQSYIQVRMSLIQSLDQDAVDAGLTFRLGCSRCMSYIQIRMQLMQVLPSYYYAVNAVLPSD